MHKTIQNNCRGVTTHRGPIKKIKFGPGRGNFKLAVLHNDGIDIWDLSKLEVYSSYKVPKDSSNLVDLDWLASDLPILAHANGSIQIIDMELKRSSSAMPEMDLNGKTFTILLLSLSLLVLVLLLLLSLSLSFFDSPLQVTVVSPPPVQLLCGVNYYDCYFLLSPLFPHDTVPKSFLHQ